MVQFYQPKDTGGEIGQLFGSGLAQGYTNRADELALQKSIESLPPNATPQEVLKKLVGTKTYSPEAKQMATKNYFAAREVEESERKTKAAESIEREKIQATKDVAIAKDRMKEEERREKENIKEAEKRDKAEKERKKEEAKLEKETQLKKEKEEKRQREIAGNEELLKNRFPDMPEEERREKAKTLTTDVVESLTKPAPKTEFQKTSEKKAAESYFKVREEIPKLKDSVANIERVVELAENLRGLPGMLKAYSGFSAEAAELNSTALPAIDTILKVFNPVGAIPTQKINLVRSEFGIKATDTHQSILGKAASLKRYLNQAIARNNDKLALYELYNQNPPQKLIDKFDEESKAIGELMVEEAEKLRLEKEGVGKTNDGKTLVKNKKTGVVGYVTLTEKNKDKYDIVQ